MSPTLATAHRIVSIKIDGHPDLGTVSLAKFTACTAISITAERNEFICCNLNILYAGAIRI